MNGRIHRNFTLIELMAVMLLMGVLMVMMLPAFNRMIRGNKVDQVTSNLKLGLEQAQARAVSSRRPVALVLPTKQNDWTSDADTQAVIPFCYGGYRLAYVEATSVSGEWKFLRWVPDSEWKNAPEGAMLVRVLIQSDSDYKTIKEGDGIDSSSVLSNPQTGALSNLMTVKSVKVGSHTVDVGGLVFSPYGGLKSDKDMRLAVAEAVPSGSSVIYPTRDSIGPVNWQMLSINKFTGRVSYYPAED